MDDIRARAQRAIKRSEAWYGTLTGMGINPDNHWVILPLLEGWLEKRTLNATEVAEIPLKNKTFAKSRQVAKDVLLTLESDTWVENGAAPNKAGKWRLTEGFIRIFFDALPDEF